MLLKSSCLFLLVTIPLDVTSVISFALVHLHFLYLSYDLFGYHCMALLFWHA